MPRINDSIEISSRLVMMRTGNHHLMGTGFILEHSMKAEGWRLHTPWIFPMPLNYTLYNSQSVS